MTTPAYVVCKCNAVHKLVPAAGPGCYRCEQIWGQCSELRGPYVADSHLRQNTWFASAAEAEKCAENCCIMQ